MGQFEKCAPTIAKLNVVKASSITYSTMDRRKLDQLWAALAAARRKPQRGSDLETLAKMAERTMVAGSNHPMWVSAFPTHRSFPIARHGRDPEVAKYVRGIVLGHIETDATAWEGVLSASEKTSGDGGENGRN